MVGCDVSISLLLITENFINEIDWIDFPVFTLGTFWLKHTKKGMIAYFHICSTVFDGDLEFISQFLLPKGNQKIYDFKLFQCDNLAFFKEFVGAFM